jgi:multidrug resistance efflux pump
MAMKIEAGGTGPRGATLAAETERGPGATGLAEGTASRPARRNVARRVVLPIALVVVALAAFFGYGYWYSATHFVSTDNAQVTGSIIQVGALNAGQVSAVYADVGDHVAKGQVIARVAVPQPVAATASGAPELNVTNAANQAVSVTAPLDGVVVARLADPGSTVQAGQGILAVIDPGALYVTANVNETDLDRVKVGETVDVTVDSLNRTLPGRVAAVTEASSASFSLIPQQNTTGNYTKVVQVVPVKIAVDYGNLPLVVGSSVEVSIHVQ